MDGVSGLGAGAVGMSLLEREQELTTLTAALTAAADGTGRLLVVEGEPGIGKTELLRAARELGRRRGMRVLAARGLELERDYSFGVVAQLFGPTVAANERDPLLAGPAALALPALHLGADAAGPSPSPSGGDPTHRILHGLYWLTANLCEQGPVVLAIDDAQWSDTASLRFVAYLAPRLRELAAVAVLTVRTGEQVEHDLLRRLRVNPDADVIQPHALSADAVASLVRARLDGAGDEVCTACFEATRGNPFLLGELLAALAEVEVGSAREAVQRIATLAPSGATRSVQGRLGRLPDAAQQVAQALAVLGDGAGLGRVARLAAVDTDTASRAADVLEQAHILAVGRPLGFKHPLVRAAVYATVTSSEKARAHRRAADLLADAGAGEEDVAVHLLQTDPTGDASVVRTLQAAARRAAGRGAVDAAAAYLTRALAEPPPVEDRPGVAAELGRVELRAGHAQAASEHLQSAFDTTTELGERAALVMPLSQALWLIAPDESEAVQAALDEIIAEAAVADPELELQLETFFWETSTADSKRFALARQRIDRLRGRVLDGATGPQRLVLAALTYSWGARGEPAQQVVAMAERALDGDRWLAEIGPESIASWACIFMLMRAEQFTDASAHAHAGLAEAQARGSASGFVIGSSLLSQIALRRGDVRDAALCAETCLAATKMHDFLASVPYGAAFSIDALIEQGDLERAWVVLEDSGMTGELPETTTTVSMLFSRGRLKVERGDLAGGLEDLLETRRRKEVWDYRNPAAQASTSEAALAALTLGDRDMARRLAEEELSLALRWGTPGQLGISLRALGIVEGGDAGIERLEEAVASLARSEMRLEHARALTDLGAALRRSNHRSAARVALRHAIELSDDCGGLSVASRARVELEATGARARRMVRTGLDDLTASERRVASLAADGLSNPEIARALFVTTKTVETHLSHVYRKLDIASRSQLANALAVAGSRTEPVA